MSKKYTYEEAKEEFEKRDYILLDDIYVNARIKMKYICKKHPNETQSISFGNLKAGHGCKYCGHKKISNSLSLDYNFVKSEFEKREYILLEDTYINAKTKMKYKCKKHIDEIQSISYDNLSHGHGCKYCAEEYLAKLKTLDYDFVKSEFEKAGYILLEKEYINAKTKMKYVCPRHPKEDTRMTYEDLKQGQRCKYCNKYQTSYPEQYIYLLMKNIFKNVKNREILDGYEFDILIYDIKLCIEYDGKYYHSNKNDRENEKELYCIKNSYDFIRIKEVEEKCNVYMKDNIIYLNCYKSRNEKTLNDVYDCLITYINNKFNLNIQIEFDKNLNDKALYNTQHCNPEKSIFVTDPILKLCWNYDKNIGLDPNDFSRGSKAIVSWKCLRCESEFKRSVINMVKSPFCHDCIENQKRKSTKMIWQYDLNANLLYIFESRTKAAKIFKVHISNIEKCCKREIKQSGGYIWRDDDMTDLERMKIKIERLNKARKDYFNNARSELSDYQYDKLFDELVELENKTGIILSNSPTQQVGYVVQNNLKKSVHKYPMLSLDKTKKVEDLISFIGDRRALLMFKMDGLSVCATYDNEGNLILCETRGDGKVGSDITENAKTFVNLPKKINHKGGLVVFGEAIIDYPTFYSVNEKLPEGSKYKNPRNLVAGSVQVLDPKVCADRGVRFIAWRLVDGHDNNSFKYRLNYLQSLGFEIVQYADFKYEKENLERQLELGRDTANELGLPIDGMVVSFDNVAFSETMGATSHHLRSQLAFKFGEDREFSTLREVEWSPSRTGQINPVAIFDPIELAGTEVSRASLSNISVMKQYNIKIGAQVEVSKRNEIIPKIENCDGNGEDVIIPDKCPVCGASTEIKISEDGVEVLVCTSESCPAKLLGKLELFVSKEGLDIDGLSTSQLQTFINRGWLKDISDIYSLHLHEAEMQHMKGFGKKSVTKLLNAIDESSTVTMANFIRALGIPLIGKTQAKSLSDFCNGDINKFKECILSHVDFSTKIDGFGEKRNQSIHDWFMDTDNVLIFNKLRKEITFIKTEGFMNPPEDSENKNSLNNQTFCITGKLNHFANRDELVKKIESCGGKYVSSVSSKTNFLINNDKESQSSKNKKAQQVGCKIISEEDFLKMIGE